MNGDLAASLLGLLSGMFWGTGDFFGGMASRRISPYSVVFFGQVIGTTVLLIFTLLTGSPLPPIETLLLGAAAGVFGSLGVLMFYRALTDSKMSIAAPLTAIPTVIIPVIAAIALEGAPQPVQMVGMIVAVLSIALISREDNTRIKMADLRLPLIAGLGFGLYLTLLARATADSPYWPIIFGRFASIALVGLIGWQKRSIRLPSLMDFRFVAASGVLDTVGNTIYALSAQVGRDDIAAVLSSLYPAATVGLAWFLLKERLHPVQWIGVGLALVAIVLISI